MSSFYEKPPFLSAVILKIHDLCVYMYAQHIAKKMHKCVHVLLDDTEVQNNMMQIPSDNSIAS